MFTRVKDRRAEEREIKNILIRFSDTFVLGQQPSPPMHDGFTFDVSDSGLSFRAYQPIEHMMAIRLSCDFLWDAPREGIVKWCSKIYPGIYKVGIALI
jgi:hypothetical protein